MRRALPVLLSIASLSCILDASIGRDDPDSAGEGGGGAFTDGSSDSGTDGTTGGGEGDAAGGGGEGEGGDTRGDDEAAGGTDTESDMLPPLCHPTVDETECAQCRKGHCCNEIIHCHDAPGCFCFWDCAANAEMEFDACNAHCDYDGDQFAEVVACQHEQCTDMCGDGNPTDLPPQDSPMD